MRNLIEILMITVSLISAKPVSEVQVPVETGIVLPTKTCCDLCQKIEYLYSNEQNDSLKEMETEFLKSSIHPENYKKYSDFYEVCTVPYNESLKYNLPILGFSSDSSLYAIEENDLTVYRKPQKGREADNRENIQMLWDFILNIKELTDGMNADEKISYIQDMIIDMLEYDQSGNLIHKSDEVLSKKQAVCTGYSNLFYLACINVGIPCECVGNKEHMFNRVFINGEWNYIDCTWNDSIGSNTWYMLKKEQLDKEHQLLNCFNEK